MKIKAMAYLRECHSQDLFKDRAKHIYKPII